MYTFQKCCEKRCLTICWESYQTQFQTWRDKVEHGKCKDKREVNYNFFNDGFSLKQF